MTRNQSASQSPPDPNPMYGSVAFSRSSWIVVIQCPLTDAHIGIHKLPSGGGTDLIDLVRKSPARVGADIPVMLCYEVSYEGFWLVRYLERQVPDIAVGEETGTGQPLWGWVCRQWHRKYQWVWSPGVPSPRMGDVGHKAGRRASHRTR